MMELFKNPVTVIFGLLAGFFMLMGFGRHMIRKRNRRAEQPKDKPYTVSDPYSAPAEDTSEPAIPAPGLTLQTDTPRPSSKRFFKQFGSNEPGGHKESDMSGYVWE